MRSVVMLSVLHRSHKLVDNTRQDKSRRKPKGTSYVSEHLSEPDDLAANKRTGKDFGKQLDLYDTSKYYRSEAASLAYAANERRLDEVYAQAKFGRLEEENALAASIGA
ncbi:MAG: hypothetical protein CM15mV135_110 [uncultured marine virus]|nr:MAG: hypothetical protein CM15mV135_110 [uncultured marine virus]